MTAAIGRRRVRRRVLRVGGAAVLAVLAAIAAAGATLCSSTLRPARATRALPGLTASVSVRFDGRNVPRISAANDADAAEALGYVHAGDRLAQMDLMRRAAGGTLAELIGPPGLVNDRAMRTLGTERAAEAMLEGLPDHTRELLLAYARGVNAWIAQKGRLAAPEYLLFGAPKRWRPTDSLLWAEAMGLYLSSNLDLELARLALEGHLSRDAILGLWPGDPADAAPAKAADAGANASTMRLAARTRDALPRFPAPFVQPDRASNEWAVDGRHSATGAPLLAGDPHLAYGLPCLWYLARIDTPAGALAGATAPGVPFVVLGRNSRVAWTFTTANADTEDVFIERVLDAGHYQGPDGPLAFATRHERIRVRGASDIDLVVRATRHGPVISDLGGDWGRAPASGEVLAASISSLQPGNQAAAGIDALDRAASLDEAGLAAARMTAPVQNLLVADRRGIGLFTAGRVPLRPAGVDGRFPVPGWTAANDWTGYASGADLPRIVGPVDGVLVNANEPVSGTSATVAMAGDAFGGWRSRRIRTSLSDLSRTADVPSFEQLQMDVRSSFVAALLPVLDRTVPKDDLSRRALALLASWDGSMSAGAPQPLIVDAWLSALGRAFAERDGDPGQTAVAPLDYLATRVTKGAAASGPLLSGTLAGATRALARRWGDDPAAWRWRDAHRAVFHNRLWDALPLIGWWRRASIPVGGDSSTVDAQAAVAAADGAMFQSVHGASFRAVYDLADPDRSRFVISTGESGNPFSRHLLDFAPLWASGASVPLGPVADRNMGELTLKPDR